MNQVRMWSWVLLMGCAAEVASDPAESTERTEEAPADPADPADPTDPVDADDPEDDGDEQDGDVQEEEEGCPDSWVLTYSLQGRIDITDTPLDLGNADALVGGLESDEIVLRLADEDGAPSDGQVLMTSFDLLQDFRVSINVLGEIAIDTYLFSTASDECGVASGQLEGSTMTWDECTYGSEHGTTRWSPDDGADGAGCIRDYHVEGIVECLDDSTLASCSDGWLEDGENVLDYVYNQPMLSLEFDSTSLERFTMRRGSYGAELPTYTNNRTWLSLEGELKSMSLEPTPDCLCDE